MQWLKDDGSCTWDRSEDGMKSPFERCATAEVCCMNITEAAANCHNEPTPKKTASAGAAAVGMAIAALAAAAVL
jgi:hypothetical protein